MSDDVDSIEEFEYEDLKRYEFRRAMGINVRLLVSMYLFGFIVVLVLIIASGR